MNSIENLSEIIQKKLVFIYGYGTLGGTAHFTLHRLGYEIEGIVDSDVDKQGLFVGKVAIISPYDLMYYNKDRVMVFVCSARAKDDVIETLESMGFEVGVNLSTFFLDGRYAPFSSFNPQIGWCRGDKQFVSCDSSMKCNKTILTLGASTTDYSFDGFVSWPVFLSEKIRIVCGGRYDVVNGGVAGYCSSHELLSFITRGYSIIPDILIVYSGYNDATGVLSYEYNDYRAVSTYEKLLRNADEDGSISMDYGSEPRDYASLWLKNSRMIHGICNEFGIKHLHILQPCLIISEDLDETEVEICTVGPYKDIYYRVNSFYSEIKSKAREYDWILDYTEIFEDNSVYIDTCHLKEEGNEIIASHIYKYLCENYFLMENSI